MLGSNRVYESVDLLREAVWQEELSASEAQHADAIRNSGRDLRWEHPTTFTAEFRAGMIPGLWEGKS